MRRCSLAGSGPLQGAPHHGREEIAECEWLAQRQQPRAPQRQLGAVQLFQRQLVSDDAGENRAASLGTIVCQGAFGVIGTWARTMSTFLQMAPQPVETQSICALVPRSL